MNRRVPSGIPLENSSEIAHQRLKGRKNSKYCEVRPAILHVFWGSSEDFYWIPSRVVLTKSLAVNFDNPLKIISGNPSTIACMNPSEVSAGKFSKILLEFVLETYQECFFRNSPEVAPGIHCEKTFKVRFKNLS